MFQQNSRSKCGELSDPESNERLIEWHVQGETRYSELTRDLIELNWPVSLYENHYHFSYFILKSESETLSCHELDRLLDKVIEEVKKTVRTGWPLFLPVETSGSLVFQAEKPEDGTGEDVCEQNLMTRRYRTLGLPDYWRVSMDGRATIFRAYLEDRMEADTGGNPVPSRWVCPEMIIRNTLELVCHAREGLIKSSQRSAR